MAEIAALVWRQLAVVRVSSSYKASSLVVVVSAWFGAVYPIGVTVPAQSAGFLGGAVAGLSGAAVVVGPISAFLTIAHVGADAEFGLDREYRLAGISERERLAAWLCSAMTSSFALVPLAAVAGATAGGVDAILGGINPFLAGPPFPVAAFGLAVGASAYLSLLAAATCVLQRSRAQPALLLGGGFAAFLLLLRVFVRGSWTRWILRLLPFGPFWSTLLPRGRGGIVLTMSVPQRSAVTLTWIFLAVVALAWRADGNSSRSPQ